MTGILTESTMVYNAGVSNTCFGGSRKAFKWTSTSRSEVAGTVCNIVSFELPLFPALTLVGPR